MHKNKHQQDSDQQLPIERIENINDYMKSYELPHHWQLRKEFIQIHAGKFDLDRLICLSNVFVNVECMGLTYPDEVMKLIKELGSKVRGLENYKYQLEKNEPELPRKKPQTQGAYNRRQYH